MSRRFALAALAALIPLASIAQTDPFAAAYGAPPQGSNSAINSSQTGSTSVSTAVGRSYAASEAKGGMSLAQIAFLPKTVAPFQVSLKAQAEKALTLQPKIAVATYALAIQRGAGASAYAGGFGSENTQRRTQVTTSLGGVSEELTAQLAQEAYDDLNAQLKAAGFDLVPYEQLQSVPEFQAIDKNATTPSATPKWLSVYAPRNAPLLKGFGFETGMAKVASAGTSIKLSSTGAQLGAVVLVPNLQIDYIAMQSSGRKTYSGNASVEAEAKFAINPSSTSLACTLERKGPGAYCASMVTQGYTSNEPFGIMVATKDKSDSKAMHNAIATLGMGNMYRQSLYYSVETAPERYAALVRAAFRGYNAALVAQIRKSRGA